VQKLEFRGSVYRSAFVCTEDAGIVVVCSGVCRQVRCHIPSDRSSPESLRPVAPGLEGLRRPVRILGRVSNHGD